MRVDGGWLKVCVYLGKDHRRRPRPALRETARADGPTGGQTGAGAAAGASTAPAGGGGGVGAGREGRRHNAGGGGGGGSRRRRGRPPTPRWCPCPRT